MEQQPKTNTNKKRYEKDTRAISESIELIDGEQK